MRRLLIVAVVLLIYAPALPQTASFFQGIVLVDAAHPEGSPITTTTEVKPPPPPAIPSAVKWLRRSIAKQQQGTWSCQKWMEAPHTVGAGDDYKTSTDVNYLKWQWKVWHKRWHDCSVVQSLRIVVVRQLDHGLKGFPLSGFGKSFEKWGYRYNVNPYMVASIAGKESTFGRNLCGHNPFGWKPFCQFSSFDEAIQTVTKGLRTNYINKGRTSLSSIGSIYCVPPHPWTEDVQAFMYSFFNSLPYVTYPRV